VIVVSDTSAISNLIQVGMLEILHGIFQKVLVPPSVDKEIRQLEGFAIDLSSYITADWIEIVTPIAIDKVLQFSEKLDAGESEAIVIALENNADYLLIDERLGTKIALSEGLTTLGLIGVLLKAKTMGLIEKVNPLLVELELKAGFWIGSKLKEKILKDTGEED
jgi:uncharacterized protein